MFNSEKFVNIYFMKKLSKSQINFIVRQLENSKTTKNQKLLQLSHFFNISVSSIKNYYYKYRKKSSLSHIISSLEKDIQNTPYIYSVKAEKGKVAQYRVRCNYKSYYLYPKKRHTNIFFFPSNNNVQSISNQDISKVLSRLANMVKDENFEKKNFDKTKLKIVTTQLDKCKLNSCRELVYKENLLKQNLKLKNEIEKLKERLRESRSLNLDKKE